MEHGKVIADLRVNAGLSRAQLAEEVSITKQYLGEIERGQSPGSVKVLRKIAAALNVRLQDLVGDGTSSADAAPTAASFAIPHEGEICPDGLVRSEKVVQIFHSREGGLFRASKDAFTYPNRLPVPGAAESWFAIDVDPDWSGAQDGEVRAGDTIIFDPDREPKPGDLVIADGRRAKRVVQLRRLREIDGELWLWPVSKDDGADRFVDPWAIVAVAVELRRGLS